MDNTFRAQFDTWLVAGHSTTGRSVDLQKSGFWFRQPFISVLNYTVLNVFIPIRMGFRWKNGNTEFPFPI